MVSPKIKPATSAIGGERIPTAARIIPTKNSAVRFMRLRYPVSELQGLESKQ
jgi:hypothetical protein